MSTVLKGTYLRDTEDGAHAVMQLENDKTYWWGGPGRAPESGFFSVQDGGEGTYCYPASVEEYRRASDLELSRLLTQKQLLNKISEVYTAHTDFIMICSSELSPEYQQDMADACTEITTAIDKALKILQRIK